MTTFNHSDVTIILLDNGKFQAKVHGVVTTSASLDAMKRKIDAKPTFKPIKIIEVFSDSIREQTVTRVKKTGGSFNRRLAFVCDNGIEKYSAHPDTPKARDAAEKYQRIKAENKAKIKVLEDEIMRAHKDIPLIHPEKS